MLEALQTGTLQGPGDTSQGPSSVDWGKKGGQVTWEDLGYMLVSTHPALSA